MLYLNAIERLIHLLHENLSYIPLLRTTQAISLLLFDNSKQNKY